MLLPNGNLINSDRAVIQRLRGTKKRAAYVTLLDQPRRHFLTHLRHHVGPCRRAENGMQIARRWCASCHVVASNQRTASEAPPFAAIAKSPDFDASKVAFFLLNPHPKMPDMSLTRNEAADLAAYIASLK